MVDHHIKDNADRIGLAIFLVIVGCLNEVDQVLFGAKVGVDVEVVVDVVAMVGTRVILEDG